MAYMFSSPLCSNSGVRTPRFKMTNDVYNQDDQKSLNQLYVKVLDIQKDASMKKTPKLKQLSLTQYCTPPSCKKYLRFDENKSPYVNKKSRNTKRINSKAKSTSVSPPILKWLQKSPNPPKNIQVLDTKTRKDTLDVKKSKKKVTKEDRIKKKKLSDSFEKYGVRLPSYEDIMKHQENLKKYKQCLEDIFIDSLDVPEFNVINFEDEESNKSEVILGCKHLSDEQIKDAFNRNLDYISDICNERRFCERHQRFKKENFTELNTVNSLTYSTSMAAFTQEQKLRLAKLLQKKFARKKLYNSQYYFKVLLPELCLKIFMDEHNMSYEEAIEYLDQRPLD